MDDEKFNSIEEKDGVSIFTPKEEKNPGDVIKEINEQLEVAKKQLEGLQVFLKEILEINVSVLFSNINAAPDRGDKHFSPEMAESIEKSIQATQLIIVKLEKAKTELETSLHGFTGLNEELQFLYNQYKIGK